LPDKHQFISLEDITRCGPIVFPVAYDPILKGHYPESVNNVRHYYNSPVFAKFAGRHYRLAGHTDLLIPDKLLRPTVRIIGTDENGEWIQDPEDAAELERWLNAGGEENINQWREQYHPKHNPNDVCNVIKDMAREYNITRFVIKGTEPKSGIDFYEFPHNANFDEIGQLLSQGRMGRVISFRTVGHLNEKFLGDNTLLVQERIPMDYEYRYFVINHELVAGAGCIDNNVPLDNEGHQQFHSAIEQDRYRPGEDHLDTWDKSIHGKLLSLARQIVALTRELEPDIHSYVIDVAINLDTGQPVMIERNEWQNAGLYATDTIRIPTAIQETVTMNPDTRQFAFTVRVDETSGAFCSVSDNTFKWLGIKF
jgi:hypothetical protein